MSRDSMTKLNIPAKIKVGYQDRSDTYSGKLGYVTYYGPKGELRKQASWEGWRSKKIDPDDFDNEPTSGFVLNKDVGGVRRSWGWNARLEKVRVYDPHGFEFEIGVPNLLFVLQECNSIKGKGLEGDFVYAWDGKELILLPTCSEEYKFSSDFTALQSKKIGKKDMVVGCWYRTKDDQEVMYLGREDWYEVQAWRGRKNRPIGLEITKKHVFLTKNNSDYSKYWEQTGFTKLAERLTTDPDPKFAFEYDAFKAHEHGHNTCEIVVTKSNKEGKYGHSFIRKDGVIYYASKSYRWYTYNQRRSDHVAVEKVVIEDGWVKFVDCQEINFTGNIDFVTIDIKTKDGKTRRIS